MDINLYGGPLDGAVATVEEVEKKVKKALAD